MAEETRPLLPTHQSDTQAALLMRMFQQISIDELNRDASNWEEWEIFRKNHDSQNESQITKEMIQRISDISESEEEEEEEVNEEEENNEEVQAASIIAIKMELLLAYYKKAEANKEFIGEYFKKLSADNQIKIWSLLPDEMRRYLLVNGYVRPENIPELCLRTEAGKRFAIMINKIMMNQRISERKRNAKLRKIWYAQSPEEQMITYCMLPVEARPKRALEFLKFLSLGFLWIAAFGLAIAWLPFNLLVGLTAASLIVLPNFFIKFIVSFSLNLTDALSSEATNRVSPFVHLKNYKVLNSDLCKNSEKNSEVVEINEMDDKDSLAKIEKITKDEHKEKKFDMDKIIFLMLSMSLNYQLQAILLFSEVQKLLFLDYLAKCKINTINPRVTRAICESTKIYHDLQLANPEEFYKKCKDDELGKKLIALLIIGESKSLNARMHFERFIGVLKCMAIPAAFLFCAMWFPFMSVLASLIPIPALALFGIACTISAFVILFKKCRNPSYLNSSKNFANAKLCKLVKSSKKEKENLNNNESDIHLDDIKSNEATNESDKTQNEATNESVETQNKDSNKSDKAQNKDQKLYDWKWKINEEESIETASNKSGNTPLVESNTYDAELAEQHTEQTL